MGDEKTPGWVLLLVIWVPLAWGGCKKPSSVVDAGADAEGSREVNETRPVYASSFVADPTAVRFCRALHGLQQEARMSCCGEKAGAAVIEGECVRMLSQAVADSSVGVDAGALSSCEVAFSGSLERCEWEVPEECGQIIEGTLGEKARCRSSLECRRGLRCLGVGPTDLGRCARPSAEGALCAISVDALASVTNQRLNETHPECVGTCGRRRCQSALDAGVPCTNSIECGAGRHCSGAKGCVPGPWAREREDCVQGACAVGLRCLRGNCLRPAPPGGACRTDQDCVGSCAKDGGCVPRCAGR